MDGERAYATEWLMNFRHIIKWQDALIKEICAILNLTRIEGTIIVFCTIIQEKILQVILWSFACFLKGMYLKLWNL